ncbi:DUF5047 domain-containing protein [Plantactinospora sp. CA-294935]|uniref:DUF5047 domain-containing protein n=1 Tax=Plantactinospora sp. CA-294935 TaxID=3240012 RepID=UPI003D926E14
MYPVSSVFGHALREAHTLAVRVDAWYDGALLIEDLPLDEGSAGQVTIQAGTGVRRQLDLTITDAGLWDDLDVTGVELRPYRGVRYPSGATELVPLGVFGLDEQSMSVGPDGGIRIRTAPDRWARVQRAKFETPASSQVGDLVVDEIVRLVTDAVSGVAVSVLATSTATVGALVWDRDRDKAIVDLATSIGAEAYFDNDGTLVVRDAPLLSQPSVWTVDASPSGVLLGGDLRRDRSRTYNVVVVSDARTDGSTPFAPQVIEDDDPASPTYVGGPFGRVPYFWSSPVVTSAPQAVVAGTTILNRVRAVNAQLNVDAVVHPGLDRGDVITVLTSSGRVEQHLVDAVTVPLTVGGVQSITTRSSRPDGAEG